MPEFLFDIRLFASVRVTSETEADARELLRTRLDCASCNGGSWPNGDPILFEASPDGEPDLIEIDGEAV